MCTDTLFISDMNQVNLLPMTPHKVATRYLYPKQKHESCPIHPLNAPCELKVETKAQLKPFMIILAVKEFRNCYHKCFKNTCMCSVRPQYGKFPGSRLTKATLCVPFYFP